MSLDQNVTRDSAERTNVRSEFHIVCIQGNFIRNILGNSLFFFRVLCYNAGIRDPSKLGEAEREYTDEIIGRIYALAYGQSGDQISILIGASFLLISFLVRNLISGDVQCI